MKRGKKRERRNGLIGMQVREIEGVGKGVGSTAH